MRYTTRVVRVMMVAALLMVAPTGAFAQTRTPTVTRLPNTARPAGLPPAKTNGLRIDIDTSAALGHGYLPIKVTVSVPAPTVAARNVTVRFFPNPYRGNRDSVTVDVEIAAGASSASKVAYLPGNEVHSSYMHAEVFDEGEPLPDLTGNISFSRSDLDQASNHANLTSGTLFVVSTKDSRSRRRLQERSLGMCSRVERTNSTYSPFDLPEEAFAWQQWNVVHIELDELQYLHSARPQVFAGLRQWVWSGGVLLVHDVGSDYDRLREFEKLLDPQAAPQFDNSFANQARLAFSWQGMSRESVDNWITRETEATEDRIRTAIMGRANGTANVDEIKKELGELRTTLQQQYADGCPFMTMRYGFGHIAVLNRPLHDNLEPVLINRIFDNSAITNWLERHGANFGASNDNYWNFRIPGVGEAPITAFGVLISLFVIAIGPLNFLWTRRQRRETLLLFTVPICAAFVTGGLLLYALLNDGLAIRSRTRSVTYLNQVNGDAACWSRIGLYASLRPADGLSFAHDIAVYPVHPRSQIQGNDRNSLSRELVQGEQQRHFTRGWLPSRVLTQFLTVRARSSPARLYVVPGEQESLQVVNQLGAHIKQLLVVDDDRRVWKGDTIDDLAGAVLAPIDRPAALKKLRQILELERLEMPADWLATSVYGGSLFRSRYYYDYSRELSGPIGEPLEETLFYLIQSSEKLSPRTYVAVVDRSPEFELGLTETVSTGDLHVIVGQW